MKGKVYLVGAGPGDYGLLTLKALECIQKADVIVYDRLANEEYLQEAKAGCEFIYVGKASSNHTLTQDEINQVIVDQAKLGKIVTRLKGGDPYVFGRGGEEGEILLEHGISFEVVPGITSAIGGLCYAGIPITHRDYTSSFHVVTGHLKDDENTSINWNALAHMGGTIVFLMGVSNLQKICSNLVAEGMKPQTPVAVINWATRVNQRVATGDLTDICEVVAREGLTSPSLIVIGEVVKLREKLNFFEERPLFGKTIVTTRARSQASNLTKQLRELGAKVIEFPTIRLETITPNPALETELHRLEDYHYVVFTSQNTVQIFFDRLLELGKDARSLAGAKIVAVGSATTNALKQYGIVADLVPERFVAESICEMLEPMVGKEDRILIPRAAETRAVLEERLGAVAHVTAVSLYENVIDDTPKDAILKKVQDQAIDYITFTSASTVTNFMKLVGEDQTEAVNKIKLIAIGDVTAKSMKEQGLTVYAKPDHYTIDEMVACIVADQQN